jgi:hypothetical protein
LRLAFPLHLRDPPQGLCKEVWFLIGVLPYFF